MRILCYINHFFGENPDFEGKSSFSKGLEQKKREERARTRRKLVVEAIGQLTSHGNIDVKVCGIEGYSLVPIDIRFDHIRNSPIFLIYESLNHMSRFVDEYDYFINMEDDVLLPAETIANVVEYDKQSFLNEVLLPNRLEQSRQGNLFCVDTIAIPGWTQQRQRFGDHNLRVALNPHSGLLILSREKFKYCLARIDSAFRKPILHNELDSAFAYFHSPFSLYRSEDIGFHYVIHLDNWMNSERPNGFLVRWYSRIGSIRLLDLVPPVLVRIVNFLKNKIAGPNNSSSSL
jgi:hypothetical protein